jgi:hypothetical protein
LFCVLGPGAHPSTQRQGIARPIGPNLLPAAHGAERTGGDLGAGRDHETHERVEFPERLGRQDRKERDVSSVIAFGAAPMPDVFAYRDGFDLNIAEPVRVEVLVLRGGPVILTASIAAAVETIHLTPDQASRLARLLAGAAIAARRAQAQPPAAPP